MVTYVLFSHSISHNNKVEFLKKMFTIEVIHQLLIAMLTLSKRMI